MPSWAIAILLIVGLGLSAAPGGRLHGALRRDPAENDGASDAGSLVTVALIFDLDQPRSGLIQVPQAPMDRVADAILRAPSAP